MGQFGCIPSKKLYRWYKEVLSEYEALGEDEVGPHDLIDKGQIIKVPIFKPENIGVDMTIDEKNISDRTYTVLGNNVSGKIAVLIESLRAAPIVQVLQRLGDKGFTVRRISRDLSRVYEWVCRQAFMNAEQIADKFHVIKNALEALQSIRIYYRQLELQRIKQLQDKHIKNELSIKKQFKQRYNQSYRIRKFVDTDEVILDNGDTILQLLARSRYLLFKSEDKWSLQQKQRAVELFYFYPEIQVAYYLISDFRKWYHKSNIGTSMKQIIEQLNNWYKAVKKADIPIINNFQALVRRHEGVILNYFKQGRTNAKAEALNGQIQRFISTSYGTRDLDFFLFRLAIYFS